MIIPLCVCVCVCVCEREREREREIKSIKQKLKVKNVQTFNETCSDLRMWGLDINRRGRTVS